MTDTVRLDTIERAVADIAAGKAVVVVDDETRENEGDLIFAAAKATPELMAFTIRWSSGVICVPMPADMLDRLEIPLMTPHNRDKMRTAYTISVDARDGVTTGISAADRSHTARVLADSATEPWEITRPGHVFPLRYTQGGVLVRRGHTEAAVDLARMAGLTPAGVLVEVVNDDGTMKRAPELREFADEHGLAMISIEDLVRYRQRHEVLVERVAVTSLPTEHGDFTAYGYRIGFDASEHLALVYGDVSGPEPVLTRVHSECLTGDVFGSHRCDCGPQLEEAMARIKAEGRGVVVYLRGHEGRGIGLGRQAPGLRPPGRRPRHGRRQPRPRPAGRRPSLRRRDPGAARPRRRERPAAHQQPRQDPGAGGVRRAGRRAGPAHAAAQRPQPGLPADQARQDGARAARAGSPGRPAAQHRRRTEGRVPRERPEHEQSRSPRPAARSTATTCGSRWSPPAGTRSSWTASSTAPAGR